MIAKIFKKKKKNSQQSTWYSWCLSDLVLLSFGISSKAVCFRSIWNSGFLLSDQISGLVSPLFYDYISLSADHIGYIVLTSCWYLFSFLTIDYLPVTILTFTPSSLMLRRSCFRQLPQILPAYSLKQCRRCQFHALATPLFKYDSSNDNGNSNKMKPSDTNRNSKQNSMEEDLEASSSNSDMGVDDITTLRSDKQQITPRRRDSSNWSRKPPYQQHYSNSQKIET